jgi:hypothetical protein
MVTRHSKIICCIIFILIVLTQNVFAETGIDRNDTSWTIYYRPGVRTGGTG